MEDIRVKIEEISEQLRKSNRNNYEATISLLEKGIEYCQILGDKGEEFSFRTKYVFKILDFDIEKVLMQFSIMVTLFDQYFDDLTDSDIYLFYPLYLRDILRNIHKTEKIELSQIDELWDDFLKRALKTDKALTTIGTLFLKEGGSNVEPKRLSPAYFTAWKLYGWLGQFDKAATFFDLWYAHLMPDEYNLGECPACALDHSIYFLLWKGDFEQTIKKGEELIENGAVYSCGEVPNITRGHLLIAYLSVGNYEKAKECYELAKEHRDLLTSIIYWNIHECQFSTALDQFEKYVSKNFQNISFDNMFSFHLGYVLFHNMLKEKGDISLSVKLPENMDAFRANHTYSVNTLKDYFQKQTQHLILAFDKRNQNTVVSDYFNNLEKIFLN